MAPFWELGMFLEGKCFKFFCEFFYGVFKVGLNTQQNSPATHYCAIQNSIYQNWT